VRIWELTAIIKSAMRNGFLLSLLGFFLSSSARPQSQGPPSSLIETIAGGEANGVSGTDFSFGSVAGLAADTAGNTYFTLQALDRVYRLGVGGHVTSYAALSRLKRLHFRPRSMSDLAIYRKRQGNRAFVR